MKTRIIDIVLKHYFKLLVIIFVVCIIGIIKNMSMKEDDVIASVYDIDTINNEVKATNEIKIEEKIMKVDIKGQVNNPGVYSFKNDDRIIDIIDKAGGLTSIADTSTINLSKKLYDEMVIYIKSKEEVNTCKIDNIEMFDEIDYWIKDEEVSTSKISISTATKEELMTLPGIGESKALSIINYRTENGFRTIEDLLNVKGIGEALFEKIKEYITL